MVTRSYLLLGFRRCGIVLTMVAMSKDVLITDNGGVDAESEPALPKRRVLPGFADLQACLSGGTDSSEAILEMRDER